MEDVTKQKLAGAVRSKTNYVALAVIVLGYLLQPEQQRLIEDLVGPRLLPAILSLLGLLLLVVRWYTTTSLEEKVQEPRG